MMRPIVPPPTKSKAWVVGKSTYGRPANASTDRVQKMFAERQIRLRPSYSQFTEPSVEVDVFASNVVERM